MKLSTCLFVVTGLALSCFAGCSSDDSGGGSGGSGATATGGVGATGGSGAVGGSGATGGSGGSGATGGSGGSGATGGATQCPTSFDGLKCSQLQTTDPKQTACLQGQCCSQVEACTGDKGCAGFMACASNCLSKGGSQSDCATQCQGCLTGTTQIQAMNDCLTACTSGDGGTTDGGTGDASTD